MVFRLCTFCFRHEGYPDPWVVNNPGKGCTYGYDHEFPEEEKKQPQPKRDNKLCVKCGLHPRNPLSLTNGCDHQFSD